MKKIIIKIISLMLVAMMIIPVLNMGIIEVSAATNQLTVTYDAAHTDFEEAYGVNDREVRTLIITGSGELTLADCDFIKNNLDVMSINFIEALFKDNMIPDGAFMDFYSLVSVAIPQSVTQIGKDAFRNCVSLKNVGLTGNLRTIGDSAFNNCLSLQNITLPGTMTKIGDSAFAGCAAMESVVCLSGNGSTYGAAQNAFTGINSKCLLVTPANAQGYDKAPFANMKKIEWNFYSLPQNATVLAGATYTVPVDVTGPNNTKAKYQWYHEGTEILGITNDTLEITNISPAYGGRYTVAVTIDGVRVLFSFMIGVVGTTSGDTKIFGRNTAPDHPEPKPPEPVKIKYDYMQCVDSKDNVVEEFNISPLSGGKSETEVKEISNTKKLESRTYIAYTKKIKELYDKDKTGSFYFKFTNSVSDGGIKIPFGIINSIKNIDLTKDNQLRITINGSGKYNVYFAVTDEKGNVLYDFKDVHNLAGVYMFLPFNNNNHIIRIDEAVYAYPVPSVKEGSLRKFTIRNSFLYSSANMGSPRFSDIDKHWGKDDIINAAKNLIVNGYPEGDYKPDGKLTRAEFTAMLTRALYHTLIVDKAKIKTYGDVKSSDWFSESIGFADIMGLTGFVTGKEFKPNQEITREEMAYMIARSLDYAKIAYPAPSNPPAVDYADKDEIDGRFAKDVEICTSMKLLQGADGNFMPKKTLTRAEAATVLNRLLELFSNNI